MREGWLVVVLAACGGESSGTPGPLSAEGLYSDIASKTIAADARALSPSYVLWSDGAAKQRWMVLPPETTIDTSDMDHWQLPIGTKLFKEFAIGGRRVETRMIERLADTGDADDYRFTPFVWLADQSDAVATPTGADNVDGNGHDVPSSELCITCHQSEPGRALGVSAVQLSGALDDLPLSNRPDHSFRIPEPALGVLHANCGHCHNERGVAPMQTLRFSVHDAGLAIEDTAPYRTTVGIGLTSWVGQGFDDRIVPGDPDASAIYYRMSQRGSSEQMPPIGTSDPDDEGRSMVRTWIQTLTVRSRDHRSVNPET